MTIKTINDSKMNKPYRIKCESCGCVIEYTQGNLAYCNDFVYCPKCKKPLRREAKKPQAKDGD